MCKKTRLTDYQKNEEKYVMKLCKSFESELWKQYKTKATKLGQISLVL